MEKVYLLITDVSFDYERSVEVNVFSTLKKAQKAYLSWREYAMSRADNNGWFISIAGGMEFEAYEEGYFAQNHLTATISEEVVN